nr:MAG TPA: hypothetical protein [Caudoviricetes sp.]DAY47660.1 MAG TPA: hypothetical protein [Caudoviricetes sp.]
MMFLIFIIYLNLYDHKNRSRRSRNSNVNFLCKRRFYG